MHSFIVWEIRNYFNKEIGKLYEDVSTIKGNGTYAIPGIAGLRGNYHLLRCQAVDCKWTQMSHLFSRCITFHGSQCESTVRLSFVWLCTEAIERLSRESKTDNDYGTLDRQLIRLLLLQPNGRLSVVVLVNVKHLRF